MFYCGCFGRPVIWFILMDGVYSILTQYKMYWLLILPYNYDTRPLSVWCGGRSMLEMAVKFEYASKGWRGTLRAVCEWFGQIVLWTFAVLGVVAAVLVMLYLSILLSAASSSSSVDSTLSAVYNDTATSYPLCNAEWSGNLSVIDLAALSLMAYDVGDAEREWNATFEDAVCLYFDGTVPDAHSEEACSWNVVYRHTADPLFVHLRRDLEHRHDDDPVFVVCLFFVWSLVS